MSSWIPRRLRPQYWRARWDGFATAQLAPPAMVIASPTATTTDIDTVLDARATIGKAEISLWSATWLAQAALLVMAAVQAVQVLGQLNTGVEQCQSGRCGSSTSIEIAVLWLLAYVALVLLVGRGRRRLEDLFAEHTLRRARADRSTSARVIAVDELDAASRWTLRRAAGLLRAYPAIEKGTLWLMAVRADAAARLPRAHYASEREQLRAANTDALTALEAAYADRQPFRLTLPAPPPERADIHRPATIDALTRTTGEVPAP